MKIKIKKKQLREHIKRTISWHGEVYDLLCELSEETGLSFNFIVNYLIEYVLTNFEIVKD